MNLKEGMYVRTKEGKILKCFKSESMNLPIYYVIGSKTNSYVEYQDVKNASNNIIDLIEVGDYVNGHKVCDDFRLDTDDYGNNFIEIGIESDKFLNHYIREDEIETIVTKEQFESMKYSLEG